jgi:hypothetical protein
MLDASAKVKSTTILSVKAEKNFFTCTKIKLFTICALWLNKMKGQKKNVPLLFWCCCLIGNPGWIKIRIRDKHPGSATPETFCFSFNYLHSVGGPAVVFGPRGHPGDSPGLPGQAPQVLLPHPGPLRPGHPARGHRTAALRRWSRHSARGMLVLFFSVGFPGPSGSISQMSGSFPFLIKVFSRLKQCLQNKIFTQNFSKNYIFKTEVCACG